MYRTYWGLRESPFSGALDWRKFLAAPTQEEALARMQFLVEERRRLGLLFGGNGVGKSMLLEVFARRLRRGGAQVANVSLRSIDIREFLWLVAAEWGINPDRRDDVFRLWRGIMDRLAENRYQQLDTVLLLDDADRASQAVLEHVVRLVQSEASGTARLTVILTSSSGALVRLCTRLLELAELRIDLEPWEAADTAQYVSRALEIAGRSEPVFAESALERLNSLSAGLPRRINQLAHLALLAGAGRQLSQIDAETVESAFLELGAATAVA